MAAEDGKVVCRGWNRGSHRVDVVEPVANVPDLNLCLDCMSAYSIDMKTGVDVRAKLDEEARPAPKKGGADKE